MKPKFLCLIKYINLLIFIEYIGVSPGVGDILIDFETQFTI